MVSSSNNNNNGRSEQKKNAQQIKGYAILGLI